MNIDQLDLTPRSLALGLGLGLSLLSFGCADDRGPDELGDDEAGEAGDTDEAGDTGGDDESEGVNETDAGEGTDTGADEPTCRDGVDCLVMCQSLAAMDPDPDPENPDLSCFLECDEGLSDDEAYALIQLSQCIGDKCTEAGACGPDGTEEDCADCLSANSNDPAPEGCVEEAAACQ